MDWEGIKNAYTAWIRSISSAYEVHFSQEEPKIKDVTNEDEEQVNAENNLQGIRYQNVFSNSLIQQFYYKVLLNFMVLKLWFSAYSLDRQSILVQVMKKNSYIIN